MLHPGATKKNCIEHHISLEAKTTKLLQSDWQLIKHERQVSDEATEERKQKAENLVLKSDDIYLSQQFSTQTTVSAVYLTTIKVGFINFTDDDVVFYSYIIVHSAII